MKKNKAIIFDMGGVLVDLDLEACKKAFKDGLCYERIDEILDACRKIHPAGVIGPVCDYRTVVGLCIDPEILRLAVYRLLKQYNLKLLLNTMIVSANVRQGILKSIKARSKNSEYELPLDAAVDATGGGYLTSMCGGKVFFGSENKKFQPVFTENFHIRVYSCFESLHKHGKDI